MMSATEIEDSSSKIFLKEGQEDRVVNSFFSIKFSPDKRIVSDSVGFFVEKIANSFSESDSWELVELALLSIDDESDELEEDCGIVLDPILWLEPL